MSGDDIVTQLRAGGRSRPEPLLCDIAADEIERLRFDCAELLDGLGRKHDYACRMDALAEERLMEVTRLRAERDASRLTISDLTAEVERLRAAGDALAEVSLGARPWITPLFAMEHGDRISAATAAWREGRRER